MTTTSNTPPALVRYTPEKDGVDHINIGPDARTELGRKLAHFTEARFIHEYLGHFDSMEGFWHFVKAATPDDRLRHMSGKAAYTYGRTLPAVRRQHFQAIIQDGNYSKIDQNPDIKALLIDSTLPFTQYYAWGPQNVLINPKTAPWLIRDFEELRDIFKDGEEMDLLPFEDYQKIIVPRRSTK